jgi:hypothetical protein
MRAACCIDTMPIRCSLSLALVEVSREARRINKPRRLLAPDSKSRYRERRAAGTLRGFLWSHAEELGATAQGDLRGPILGHEEK